VLMDDARCFVGAENKFTAVQLVAWIEKEFPGRKAEIVRDIVRVTRREASPDLLLTNHSVGA